MKPPTKPPTARPAEPPSAEDLRPILQDFYDRVFADVMIGFFFEGKDKRRLVDKEIELALVMFGAPGAAYTGRPLGPAHEKHPIMGGHFARRSKLLADTLRDHGFPQALADQWLAHTESLRPLITAHLGGDCD